MLVFSRMSAAKDSASNAGSELSEEGGQCSQDGHSADCQTDEGGAEDYAFGTFAGPPSPPEAPASSAPDDSPLDMSATVKHENGLWHHHHHPHQHQRPTPSHSQQHQESATSTRETNGGPEEQPLNMSSRDQVSKRSPIVKMEHQPSYAEGHMAISYGSALGGAAGVGVGVGSTRDGAPATPDNLSAGTKDEDDDDEDDDVDRIDPNHCDPERLKAFNMFVRLFVDENLDRMVPISKQPKEKIQAIIDSCSRQFPEFSDRARKRIRTYLKSCRRNKRTRDHCGWDVAGATSSTGSTGTNAIGSGQGVGAASVSVKHGISGTGSTSRPTPPHLTSAMAEQILANACENESQNAKRMRLGLKPLSVAMDDMDSKSCVSTSVPGSDHDHQQQQSSLRGIAQVVSMSGAMAANIKGTRQMVNASQQAAAVTLCSLKGGGNAGLTATTTTTNGSCHRTLTGQGHLGLTNGPTDLTVKRSSPSSGLASATGVAAGVIKYTLNTSEMAAVRQLIAGYRESAAFLLRSADELEQLLLQQN